MNTTSITLRLSHAERQLLTEHAGALGVTVEELLRTSALSRAEDLYDLQAWDEARREFDRYPHALTAEEVARKYL